MARDIGVFGALSKTTDARGQAQPTRSGMPNARHAPRRRPRGIRIITDSELKLRKRPRVCLLSIARGELDEPQHQEYGRHHEGGKRDTRNAHLGNRNEMLDAEEDRPRGHSSKQSPSNE